MRNTRSPSRSQTTHKLHKTLWIGNSWRAIGPASSAKGCSSSSSSALQDVADRSRHDVPSAPLSAVARRVTFPYDVWRLADVRWQDLGYRSLSAYITGLIRYDLLVSGPHSTITADCRSKIQRALTRKTLAARRKGDRRKILLDHLIERAEGRSVTDEELEKMKAQIAETLRNISLGS